MLKGSGKALLFDIDGTLADTDALHLEAFNQVLGPRGHIFDHARFSKELQGFSNASISERFLADEPPERQASIIGEKEGAFRKLVSGKIRPVQGLMALLARGSRKYPYGSGYERASPKCRNATFRTWNCASVQSPHHRR